VRLAWITDPHLDHVRHDDQIVAVFAEQTADVSDCCVITGDISQGPLLKEDLKQFARNYGKPTYVITGNHDAWGTSFDGLHKILRETCAEMPLLTWLTESKPIKIGDIELCGVDGWYDARCGDPLRTNMLMNDWLRIRDLRVPYLTRRLVDKCRELGDESAITALRILSQTKAKRVIFATHVPPFEEAAWHLGWRTERGVLPWYTNRALGEALRWYAVRNSEQDITVLCGHCHSGGEYRAESNLNVLTGAAEYGAPGVVKVFDV
jgi:Icc protein